jgi:DegV family protein with EDD domain
MKIITDSAADLTPDDIAADAITVAPLYIQFPEGEIASERLSHDAFYQRLEAMQPQLPTTAQPSPGDFARLYEGIRAGGDEALSIHISSGLSGTVNSARIAAEQVGGVHVVDTMTLSGGERFQLLAAARAIKAGWPIDAILAHLDKVRAATEVVFTLETLDYLARGGRIGRVQALAGSILNLKPIITVAHEDGKYSTAAKARTMSRALPEIVAHLSALYGSRGPLWVSVMHGRFQERAEQLSRLLSDALPVARLEVLRISPVLGVHTGPGVVGAAVVPMALMDEIG